MSIVASLADEKVCRTDFEGYKRRMEKPPTSWNLSMLSRAMLDFDIMLRSEAIAPFFRNIDTIKDIHAEQKRLASKLNVLYAITFIGALFVLSGPLPSETKIAAFGIEAPLGAIPQQIIAVMMAVSYSMYGTTFASFLILTPMGNRILQAEGWESWHFFAARFDASTLWSTLIMPRAVGYASPRRQKLIAWAILLISILAVIAHSVVIFSAATVAVWTAITKGSWWLATFGSFAVAIVGVTIMSLTLAILLPVPFRLNAEEAEVLDDSP